MVSYRAAGVAAAALATALTFSLSSAVADEAPADDSVDHSPLQATSVEVASINGSGCSSDSTNIRRSSNGSLDISYDDFLARTGAGAEVIEFRKNCALSLEVDGPDGYSFAIRGLDHRGVAYLQDGANGLLRTQYYVQGETDDSVQEESFEGPYASLVSADDNLPSDELVWTPCDGDRNINVNIEVRVSPPGSDDLNLVALESSRIPGQLAWRRC